LVTKNLKKPFKNKNKKPSKNLKKNLTLPYLTLPYLILGKGLGLSSLCCAGWVVVGNATAP
jgi:hypothetical protein